VSIGDKHLVLGGAGAEGHATPWRTISEIVGRALKPLGYESEVDGRAWGVNNPRHIADGHVDFGSGHSMRVRWAYEGIHDYAKDGPRKNIRVIASIEQPSWMTVAVRAETNITDLSQIKERRLPARVRGGGGVDSAYGPLWAHYGLSKELIESYGGTFPGGGGQATPGLPTIADRWELRGDFDVVTGTIYCANTPEARFWLDLSVNHNLRFLDIPQEVMKSMCDIAGGTPGLMPHELLRGVDRDVAAVCRSPQVVYGRDDMPDEFAYLVAKALDDRRHLFRETALPLSYDSKTVAQDIGVPLHEGAKRYYREVGYLA
jgi:TRAP-type uncharacterized transport system substrate-binding protein